MVRNRTPIIIVAVLVALLAIVSVFSVFILFGKRKNPVDKTKNSSSDFGINETYYIDAYSDVLLRFDGYINAGGEHLLVSGTKVIVLEDTTGPMTKIKTSDNQLEGFVPDQCLRKEGTAALRAKTNRVVSAQNKIYYIESASSVYVYNGADVNNLDKYTVIGYLPAKSPIRIIEEVGDKYGKVVDNYTGLIGYIDISEDTLSQQLSKDPEQGKDYYGNAFRDKIEEGTLTVVNTTDAVPFLKKASVTSDVQWMMKPGTWVRVIDVENNYAHVRTELGEQIEGYLKKEYLYDPSGQ